MEYLQRLAAYTSWANRLWLDFAYDTAQEEGYLTRLVSHVYLAERVWFQRIRGEATDKDVFKTQTKVELLDLADQHLHRYSDVLSSDLRRVLTYRRFTGDEYESALSDILLHLFTHGSHHRGQMASYASQKKLGPPNTDLITFSRIQD
ncbi:MAG: DUF664 domain-containing protein [Candidatus Hydrogenedentes bacterium]|nr:DUF664 domain-containing protein [Candidatus Hydrogenedentota bacterium]